MKESQILVRVKAPGGPDPLDAAADCEDAACADEPGQPGPEVTVGQCPQPGGTHREKKEKEREESGGGSGAWDGWRRCR